MSVLWSQADLTALKCHFRYAPTPDSPQFSKIFAILKARLGVVELTVWTNRDADNWSTRIARGCSDGTCTARDVPPHIFAVSFAEARALHGAAAIGHAAEGSGCLRFGDWCNPPRCGLRVSRRLVFRPARVFDGRDLGDAPTGQPADRHRFWPPHRRAVCDAAFDIPCDNIVQSVATRRRPVKGRRLRPEIAARHPSDPRALGPRQRAARLSRRARVGNAAGARIHWKGRKRIRRTFCRHTI